MLSRSCNQIDISGVTPRQALALFEQCFTQATEVREFTADLVTGTWRERRQLDSMIAAAAEHWRTRSFAEGRFESAPSRGV